MRLATVESDATLGANGRDGVGVCERAVGGDSRPAREGGGVDRLSRVELG